MTRLIPKVMLFMMVVSLLFIATAAANSLMPMHYESGMVREPYIGPPEPYVEPHRYYDYFDYVIVRIQSIIRIIPYDSRVAHIISGNFPGLADGYNSDRLQDLINDFRTRV
jgi:hypothetical protein